MAQDTIIALAPEVQDIAEGLIRTYQPELLEATILYLFTSAAASCKPQKCSPALRYGYSLHLANAPRAAVDEGPDFLVWINDAEWATLLPGQQEPFVFHRLLHIERIPQEDGGVKWGLLPHQVEEFPIVVATFGVWSDGLKTLQNTMQQMSLPLEETIVISRGDHHR